MRQVVYHRHAARYLRRMPADRKEQVKAAVAQVADLDDPQSHPNVRVMGGQWNACLRLRVGRYRAIFRVVPDEEIERLEVLEVGPRGDFYKG